MDPTTLPSGKIEEGPPRSRERRTLNPQREDRRQKRRRKVRRFLDDAKSWMEKDALERWIGQKIVSYFL